MSSEKTDVMVIRTPEGITFPLLLACPVTRFLAWSMDAACIAAGSLIVGTLLGALRLINWDFAKALTILSYFFISIGYPIFTEWYWRGQTLGKRLLRLRVMDAQGLHLQFSQVFIRNILRAIDFLPVFYVVGGITSLFNSHAQRLGDVAANTIVVREPALAEPDLSQILAGKYNSFRDYPHLTARLRQRISTQEAGIIMQSILRRDQLGPTARVQLFGELVTHLKKIVELPQEATEGLTDEQYVRNVVDILFQRVGTVRSPLHRQ